jgi:hypothetical protein
LGKQSELKDMTRRYWISLALTLPVFLAMSEMLLANQCTTALGER